MRNHVLFLALAGWLLAGAAWAGESRPGPPGTGPLPDGLGTNIHFTDPKPGEMKMLAEGGFRWLRMDFVWERIERKKGQYDWSPYDRLLAAGEPHGMRFLFILDYSNKLYETQRSVRTAAGRAAMARWAAAAVKRYRGRGILWEMWNEPNIAGFWKPRPDAKDYILLAKAVGEAIREAAPGEMYIGPATSTVDFGFLEACFRGGLLEYWSAVSVHPYRQQMPETVEADYARLRRLIRKYAPKDKQVPILSGEWGYSSVWRNFDDQKQGKYLARQWLVNLANDVPLSIWYDWHDDGRDPEEAEHHFGTVAHAHHAGREPVYDPKDAYLAAKTLTSVLKGFRFNKRIAVGGRDNYVLLFGRGDDVRLAAWTTAGQPRTVTIPASPGRFSVTAHTGKRLPSLSAGKKGPTVTLTDAPQYLVPAKPNDLLRIAAAWRRAPLDWRVPVGRRVIPLGLSLRNPLSRPVRASQTWGRLRSLQPGGTTTFRHILSPNLCDEPLSADLKLTIEGMGSVVQTTTVQTPNRLLLEPLMPTPRMLLVRVCNPAGEAVSGQLVFSNVKGLRLSRQSVRMVLEAGEIEKPFPLDLAEPLRGSCSFEAAVRDDEDTLRGVTLAALAVLDDFARYTAETLAKAYRLVADGEAKVASTQSMSLAEPEGGPPLAGVKCLRITYEMAAGWKFIRLAPRKEEARKIEGKPEALAFWLHGDGSGHSPRVRFRDATGQTFQPTGERIRWKGWKYVSFPMDGRAAGHWGGAGDGAVHYPIRLDTLLLIDKDRGRPGKGEVYIASPTLLY